MFLLYLSLGLLLGFAAIAALNITNTPSCSIVFTGHSTIVTGCTTVPDLHKVIEALNNRLSFST